jgi:hypothetical protein
MGLDFLAATEHRDAGGYEDWARRDLLGVPGREATTDTGHWLALGIAPGHVVDWRYGVRDGAIDRYLAEVHRLGGLCVAAHPHAPYPSGQFMYPYAGIDVIEVWNGPWTSDRPWQADNESALAEWGRTLAADVHSGQWRPAMGNSDTHYEGQLGIPHTVVRAESLTAGAVLAGIRAGRSWIAASADVSLAITATTGGRSAGIGERLAAAPDAQVLAVGGRLRANAEDVRAAAQDLRPGQPVVAAAADGRWRPVSADERALDRAGEGVSDRRKYAARRECRSSGGSRVAPRTG